MTNPDHKDSQEVVNGFVKFIDQTAVSTGVPDLSSTIPLQYLKKAGPDSSVFMFLVVTGLGLLVCLIAVFASTRVNNDDIAPTSEATTVGESSQESLAEGSKKIEFR